MSELVDEATKITELVALMRYLGTKLHHVMIRVDPLRAANVFTVVIDGNRAGDTDNPIKLIHEYITKEKF